MATTKSPFGQYLRAQRKAARYSQAELGKVLGFTHGYLSQVERGARAPIGPEHWAALVKALPGVSLAELQRAAAMTRPLEIDLAKAAPEQVELALTLALRIRNRDLGADEAAALLELARGGGAATRAHGRVVDRSGAPVTGRAFVYRLGKGRGWSAVVGVRSHAGRAIGPIDGRAATLTGKPVDLGTAKDPAGSGTFDVPGGLTPGEYALDVHLPDGREVWAFPLTVTDGAAPQDVPVVTEASPPPAPKRR